jgi:flagellar biosynthesis protein FlhG
VRQFASAADTVLIVTTPEPTSIADAYATIKSLSACDETLLEVIVNQAHSVEQAREILRRLQRTSRIFLKCETFAAGIIPFDRNVGIAVTRRKPFLLDAPECPASQQIKRLARRLMGIKLGQPSRGYFFTRLWNRLLRRAA